MDLKTTVGEEINVFGGFISRLGMTKGRISEFDDMIIDTFKTEMKKEKDKRIKEQWNTYK